ncbi:MAG TPA: NAD-binding oxidoreductase, partial [Oceanospirillaceae bacterium]|nr:NAD-binding oxidoreductase [Oceanospirillaceae bacterium]
LEHEYINGAVTDAPILQVRLSKAKAISQRIMQYQFTRLDGGPLPAATAGSHIDVLIAPEFLRQYSLSSDPADTSHYQIAVLHEDQGRGGSALMQRIFTAGRKVFVSKPTNHFPVAEEASKSYLMGGGIGITPMIAMAHRLHTLGADFALHYCCSRAQDAGFEDDLKHMPWADKVHLHYSDQGSRANLSTLLNYQTQAHVYTCGPENFMQAVLDTAQANGFPEQQRHMEYFSVPDLPQYDNHEFTLRLSQSQQEFHIPATQSATEVLLEAGINIEVKCADGICGVCKCAIVSGQVEHRDFVLSNQQRQTHIILCQSRAAQAGGVLEVDV